MASPHVAPRINDSSNLTLTLLSEVDEVTEEEISALKAQLIEPLVPVFDEMSRHKQAVLAALFRRDFEQLVTLARSQTYLVGLHDVRNDLHFLLQGVTGLSKRWNQEKQSEKK